MCVCVRVCVCVCIPGGEDGANAGGWYGECGAPAHGVRDVDRQVGRQVQRRLLKYVVVVYHSSVAHRR